MKKIENLQKQLSLNIIWTNIFMELCNCIVGNNNKQNYFVISEDEKNYFILRASRQEHRWECMLENGISHKFKKIKNSKGDYTREYSVYVRDLLDGKITSLAKGNSERNTNRRYAELLEYCVSKGCDIIKNEIEFLKHTIITSCMLKMYLDEQTKKGIVFDESKVSKEILKKYENSIRLDIIGELIRGALAGYFEGIIDEDPFQLLAIVVIQTIAEVSINDENTGIELKNAAKIMELQKKLLDIIEGYPGDASERSMPEVTIALTKAWRRTWRSLRSTIIEKHNYAESSDFIAAIDNTYTLRARDIRKAALEIGFRDRIEINAVWTELKDEMEQMELLLERLERYRELMMKGLEEWNRFEKEKERDELVEEAVFKVIRRNDKK